MDLLTLLLGAGFPSGLSEALPSDVSSSDLRIRNFGIFVVGEGIGFRSCLISDQVVQLLGIAMIHFQGHA